MQSILESVLTQIQESLTINLSTSMNNIVTVRPISAITFKNCIFIKTSIRSTKYKQIQENPNVAISVNTSYLKGTAEIIGNTLADSNEEIKEAYIQKFSDAFTEDDNFAADDDVFIKFCITELNSWVEAENDFELIQETYA